MQHTVLQRFFVISSLSIVLSWSERVPYWILSFEPLDRSLEFNGNLIQKNGRDDPLRNAFGPRFANDQRCDS